MRLTPLQAHPRPVAVARIGLGIAAIANSVEMYVLLRGIAGGKLALPVHGVIPSPTPLAAHVYLVAAVVAGVALTVGWRTTTAAVATVALNVGVFLWDQQTYSSHRLLGTLLVAYLVFARSDAAWSLSSRAGPVPWWPQLLMMSQLSVCYFFAAISKVNVVFLSGAPLSLWVWMPLPWWLFTLMAAGTVAGELFLAFGLWHRSTVRAAATFGVALHISIVVLLEDQTVPLTAFGLTCLCLYGLFLHRPDVMVTAPADSRPGTSDEAEPVSR
ncbi:MULTISPECIES: HTTM domain-containing protein [unclassified Blastococcus]